MNSNVFAYLSGIALFQYYPVSDFFSPYSISSSIKLKKKKKSYAAFLGGLGGKGYTCHKSVAVQI